MENTKTIKLRCNICNRFPKDTQEVLEINDLGYHILCAEVCVDIKGIKDIYIIDHCLQALGSDSNVSVDSVNGGDHHE